MSQQRTIASHPTTSHSRTQITAGFGSNFRSRRWAAFLVLIVFVVLAVISLPFRQLQSHELSVPVEEFNAVANGLASFQNRARNKSGSTVVVTTLEDLPKNKDDPTTAFTNLNQSLQSPLKVPGKFNYSKFAYVYVIGGCMPQQPSYRGYIYNILVSTRNLQKVKSQADVVVMFLLHKKSPYSRLPEKDTRPLRALGVKIYYLSKTPPDKEEDFLQMQMRKFDILNLTQYDRVLHMDGDVMPVANLDFLFEMSMAGLLKENVVISGFLEPANGGFFMVAPGQGRLEQIHDIIEKRNQHDAQILPSPEHRLAGGGSHFDTEWGWGHVHKPEEEWLLRGGKRGSTWDFNAAFADQGLLYHYGKFERKNVSFIFNSVGTVIDWGEDPATGAVVNQGRQSALIAKYAPPTMLLKDRNDGGCVKWMCEYVHFSGNKKPWYTKPFAPLEGFRTRKGIYTKPSISQASMDLWWHTLRELDTELSLQLNLTHWDNPGRPTLGVFSKRVGFVISNKSQG